MRALSTVPIFADQKQQTIICASEIILLAVNVANQFVLIDWILLQTVLATTVVAAQYLYRLTERSEKDHSHYVKSIATMVNFSR